MEHWKSIEGYEGLYEVSDLGRVRSIRNNLILKPYSAGYTGYLKVEL